LSLELLTPLPEGRKPRRDDEFECRVTRLGRRGGAFGRWGPYQVALRRGVPGELLRCQVTRRRGELVRARVLEVLEPSPRAVEPVCEHFASCGGCSFQDVSYDLQLEEVHARLVDLFAPLLALGDFPLAPVAAAGPQLGYRNKMDFTFGAKRWVEEGEEGELRARDFALGLHAPGRHDKVLDVTKCWIAFEEASPILSSCRELSSEMDLSPWDLAQHTGLLRHLVLRKGFGTGEVLAYLVTSSQAGVEGIPGFAAALVERHPEITTLVHGVRDAISSVSEGETDEVLFGPGVIREVLGGITFELSARSFFQTNTAAAESLFELVAREACPSKDEVVFDMYCGAGSIALLMAASCREVWGFEIIEAAVVDAKRNAAAAGISNAHFVAGDARVTASAENLEKLGAPHPDVVIVDPPRAGLHPDVTAFLGELAAPRLVYVSCNPKAAVGDLTKLIAAGYRIVRAAPVDLFPHTPHVECVFTLLHEPSCG